MKKLFMVMVMAGLLLSGCGEAPTSNDDTSPLAPDQVIEDMNAFLSTSDYGELTIEGEPAEAADGIMRLYTLDDSEMLLSTFENPDTHDVFVFVASTEWDTKHPDQMKPYYFLRTLILKHYAEPVYEEAKETLKVVGGGADDSALFNEEGYLILEKYSSSNNTIMLTLKLESES